MATREGNRLNARFVETVTKPGNYIDGRGLRLRVQANGAKSWIFRYSIRGREREMGLGPQAVLSLAQARERAAALRLQALDRIDPLAARDEAEVEAKLAEAREVTFKDCADSYIRVHRSGWKNEKHAAQWESTLKAYAFDTIGSLPVSKIDTGLVLKVIETLWTDKTETANRVRGRIETILDWARTKGYRTGENPARWKGHLDQVLPRRSKVAKVEHHPALPYAEMADFFKALRAVDSTGARAFEFIILTATRTSEALNATWNEIDFAAKVWKVPAERMKAGKEHKVPLSDAAIRVLKRMEKEREDDWVFPGQLKDKPLSNMACLSVRDRMGRSDMTVHGFRSTFRDWAAETTGHPSDVCEAALAHAVSDKTQAAYQRGDLFEKRAVLMADWATYCETPRTKGVVVQMRKKA